MGATLGINSIRIVPRLVTIRAMYLWPGTNVTWGGLGSEVLQLGFALFTFALAMKRSMSWRAASVTWGVAETGFATGFAAGFATDVEGFAAGGAGAVPAGAADVKIETTVHKMRERARVGFMVALPPEVGAPA
jgi:hypothetical protein